MERRSLKPHERNPTQPDERWSGRHDDAPAARLGVAEGRAETVDAYTRDGGDKGADLNTTAVPAGVVDPERERWDASMP